MRILSLTLLAVLCSVPAVADAKSYTRSCKATGVAEYSYKVSDESGVHGKRLKVNIKPSDVYVVAQGRGATRRKAKKVACKKAVTEYVQRLLKDLMFGQSLVSVAGEVERFSMKRTEWVHGVGCSHAAAGNVPGIKRTKRNKLSISHLKVTATAERDGIKSRFSKKAKGTVCWESQKPSTAGSGPAPARAGATPPRAAAKPKRAASTVEVVQTKLSISRIGAVSCPTTYRLRADFFTTKKGKVKFRVRDSRGGHKDFVVMADQRVTSHHWRARFDQTLAIAKSEDTKYMVEALGQRVVSDWAALKVTCKAKLSKVTN